MITHIVGWLGGQMSHRIYKNNNFSNRVAQIVIALLVYYS